MMEKKVAECVVNISDASNLLSDYDHMSPGDSHPDTTQHEIQLASLGFQSGKFVGNIVPELGKKLRIPNLSEQIHPRRYQKLNSNSKLEGFFTIDVGSALLLQERMRRIRQKRGRSNTKQSKDQVSFQHQSLDVRQATCCPPPLFILGVSVLQLVVFIYNEVAPDANFVECSLLIFNPTKRLEIWRYLSYMLIHSGHVHFIINILSQIALGLPLEKVHGSWKVLVIYSSGVLAGSLGTSIFIPEVYLSGSSSGTYALITAHLATTIMNFSEASWRWTRILLALGFFLSEVIVFFYKDLSQEIVQDLPISYPAHIGGAGAGFLIGVVLLASQQPNRCQIWIQRISCLIFITLMISSITFSILCSDYFDNAINRSFILVRQKSCDQINLSK